MANEKRQSWVSEKLDGLGCLSVPVVIISPLILYGIPVLTWPSSIGKAMDLEVTSMLIACSLALCVLLGWKENAYAFTVFQLCMTVLYMVCAFVGIYLDARYKLRHFIEYSYQPSQLRNLFLPVFFLLAYSIVFCLIEGNLKTPRAE